MPKKVDILYPYTKGKWKGEITLKDQEMETINDETIKMLEDLAKRLSGYVDNKQVQKKSIIAHLISKKSQTDQILAVFYSLYQTGVESISTEDIEIELKKIKITKPGNLHDVMNRLIRRGFIMESDITDGKKKWSITQLGIEYTEEKIIKKD